MELRETKLKGTFEITRKPLDDFRGYMLRLFDDKIFEAAGLNSKFVQISRSHTIKKNTVRGLHVSLPPALEGKCISAITGEMMWVFVDLRKGSETFGQWDSVVLSGEKNNALIAQRGFAHGCRSLSDNADVLLMADNYYTDDYGTGLHWKDPDLNVDWGLEGVSPVISDKDNQSYISFREFKEQYGPIEV